MSSQGIIRTVNVFCFLTISGLLVSTCERLDIIEIVKVVTRSVSYVSYHSAFLEGTVVDVADKKIVQHGHCWSLNKEPSMFDAGSSFSSLGTLENPQSYTSYVSNLSSGTTYYYRSYCYDGNNVYYGTILTFATISTTTCIISTADITNISADTAQCGGMITSDGGESITARGVCWNRNGNPTVNDTKTNDGNGPGAYTSSMKGLARAMTYYVRAYAVNIIGTSYGKEISFRTKAGFPKITTSQVLNVRTNTAISGGYIADDGGFSLTERGVCWSLIENPTVDDDKTIDGSGIGTFISSISNLQMNNTYYIRSYATNSLTTTYGNQFIIKTLPDGIDGLFIKFHQGEFPLIDGNEDDIWKNVQAYTLDKNYKTELPTVTAYWKGAWDDSCIYILVNVEDDNHYPAWKSGGNSWEFDKVETYFDVNETLVDGNGPSNGSTGHWQIAPILMEEGYNKENYTKEDHVHQISSYNSYGLLDQNCTYELKFLINDLIDKNSISLDAASISVRIIGFDVTVVDQDQNNTTNRNRKVWISDGNNGGDEAWNNMDRSGKIVFR
jgi:hypothetical protein